MSGDRLRVTIDSPQLLTIQPTEEVIRSLPPPASDEWVTELPATNDDRARGRRRFEVVTGGWRFEAIVESADRADLREKTARAAQAHGMTASVSLRAQIPGRVVRLWVADGEQVEQGQRLLAIEAMKMENEIRAPHAGVVSGLRVAVGQTVERGDELLSVG